MRELLLLLLLPVVSRAGLRRAAGLHAGAQLGGAHPVQEVH